MGLYNSLNYFKSSFYLNLLMMDYWSIALMHYEHFIRKRVVCNNFLEHHKGPRELFINYCATLETLVTFFLFNEFQKYLFSECYERRDATYCYEENIQFQLTFNNYSILMRWLSVHYINEPKLCSSNIIFTNKVRFFNVWSLHKNWCSLLFTI